MTPPGGETLSALRRLGTPLRQRGWVAVAGASLGAALAGLGVVAWGARLWGMATPAWVLVAWLLALGGGAALAAASRRWLAAFAPRALAERLERDGAFRRGALGGLLEAPQAGVSPGLAAAADQASAHALAERGASALAGTAAAVARRLRAAGALLALGAVTLGTAGPVRGPARALWHPVEALRNTVAPVRLAASAEVVERGRPVAFSIEAPGHASATLWLRAPGEAWAAVIVPLDSAGRGSHAIAALESDLFARATSGGRSSDTVAVRMRLPAFLASLAVTARYPRYLGLEDEPIPTTGDTVIVPEGTRLEVRGEATAALAAASWTAGSAREPLTADGKAFAGAFTPATGTWRLELATTDGRPLAGDPVALPIRVVPDSAPVVEIPVPGADTTAPPDLRLTLVVDLRDDHGLRSAVLETRRISRLGFADSVRREPLALPGGGRALVDVPLDLRRLGLVPGDTLRYLARAVDNSPRAQAGRSREFVLRVPTLAELRADQRAAATALGGQLDTLVARSKRVERAAEDLARAQPRDASRPGRTPDDLAFEQARKAEQVAQSERQLLEDAEQTKQLLDRLQQSAENAGLADSAFQARLQEVREQLAKALSPELREKLRELEQALKDLDAGRTQDALKDLAARQQELREALERSRKLFERAALEGSLANLKQESAEIRREQEQWNRQVEAADSARAAQAEQQLAQRTDSLAAALKAAAQALDGKHAEALERMSQQAQQAAGTMRKAARAAKQGQRPQARQQGQQAQEELGPMEDQLDEEREGMQEEWRQEILDALDQALADVARLGDRQLRVVQGLQRGDPLPRSRADQGAVQEGTDRLLEQLREAAGKNALVPPQIAGALAAASQQMAKAREAIANANPNAREAADAAGEALDALNAAAFGMLRARGDVSGSKSGSGLAEALQQMAQLASQQGQLGQQGAGLLPMMGGAGAPQMLQQLAQQQRALAQALEKLRGQGNLPGAGEMAGEAKDLARSMEAGRLDRDMVERQERLFRRMLDAGRTLQGREEDEKKERQSTSATGDSVRIPPALRRLVEDDARRPRLPSWEELQRLSPEERRLVVDYFRRLTAPAGP